MVVFIHLSNAIYLCAYLVKDILWLRVLTVVAGLVLLGYYAWMPAPVWLAIVWNIVFTAINLRQIEQLLHDCRPVTLQPDELLLYRMGPANGSRLRSRARRSNSACVLAGWCRMNCTNPPPFGIRQRHSASPPDALPGDSQGAKSLVPSASSMSASAKALHGCATTASSDDDAVAAGPAGAAEGAVGAEDASCAADADVVPCEEALEQAVTACVAPRISRAFRMRRGISRSASRRQPTLCPAHRPRSLLPRPSAHAELFDEVGARVGDRTVQDLPALGREAPRGRPRGRDRG